MYSLASTDGSEVTITLISEDYCLGKCSFYAGSHSCPPAITTTPSCQFDERSEQKIRGGTFSRIYGDELTLWPASFFRMALTRMSTEGAKLGGTTNPDAPRHWLKAEFMDREDELDLRSFHFTFADNPSLGPTYLDRMEKEFTGIWYKRFVKGLWVIAEGAIWDAYDSERRATMILGPECAMELAPGEGERHAWDGLL